MTNLALIGYGYWGKNLFRCFSQTSNSKLEVCCEPESSRHTGIRLKHPTIAHIDTSLKQTLSRPEIDAVVIATPAGMHYEQTKAALEHGKHVFVEKPLATSEKQATELLKLARKKSVKLFVGHTFIYNDAVRWVKNYLQSGELGELYYVYMQRLALGRVRQDVNALWNLAPHDFSILHYWFDELPKTVSASGVSMLQKGIDDISFVSLEFPSGRFAHVHVSWLDPSKTRKAVIVGSKKMLVYDDTSLDRKITVYDKGVDKEHIQDTCSEKAFDNFYQFTLIQRAGDILIPKINFREPLQVEAQHFVDCINQDLLPLTDGSSGVAVVKMLEAADKARLSGRTVEFTDFDLQEGRKLEAVNS